MKNQAFTLIELLIVVAIIGILAAIAVPNFLNAQVRAKVARVRADVRALSTALEMYNMDNNSYPVDWGGPDVEDRSWKQLTTPVAYISGTGMTRDPFTDDGSGALGSFSNQRVYYDYGGGAWYNSLGESDARKAFYDRTVGFLILSFGPNKAREFPWGDSDITNLGKRNEAGMRYVFNSSNGVSSSGDIFATRSGPIE
ncbi:prepilin-type N-terminal cleavage/methylation domain-containing protein [bacterium]|nr:prepilin-type N-terminal cleavage/methylation domain-containing protein [bacterium]